MDNEKVIVITREGNQISLAEWQKIYGLPVGSSRIGEYFYITEPKLKENLEDYGELIVNELLIRFLDALRKSSNHPLDLNSFNRSDEKQKDLKAKGFRAAETSPHVVKKEFKMITGACGADVDTLSKEDTYALVKRAKLVADIVKIKVRIGYKQYLKAGQTFVHFDVCPEFYAPGKPWYEEKHPLAWESEMEW